MTDAAALGPNLPEGWRAKIDRVYGDRRRTFSAAIPFVRTDAKMILEGLRNAVGQFFGAGHNEAQASEILGGAAAGGGVRGRPPGGPPGERAIVFTSPRDARSAGVVPKKTPRAPRPRPTTQRRAIQPVA